LNEDRVSIRSGRSRFNLSALPAADYPSTDAIVDAIVLEVKQGALKTLFELTQFAMAHQDVRYYLNGLLLEIGKNSLRAIATDGHRLAMAECDLESGFSGEPRQIIVPRKAVLELSRLLSTDDSLLQLEVGANAVRARLAQTQLTSKLIDGRFPNYDRVIPDLDQCDKIISVEREALRQSLARASILSNEKYRAIRLNLEKGVLRILANNPDQEEAEDELEIDYDGEAIEIGFNVSYLIEALAVLPSDIARVHFSDASSSCLIRGGDRDDCQYVVMPMRL
jgi:DNA polymerase-3 subunit beta